MNFDLMSITRGVERKEVLGNAAWQNFQQRTRVRAELAGSGDEVPTSEQVGAPDKAPDLSKVQDSDVGDIVGPNSYRLKQKSETTTLGDNLLATDNIQGWKIIGLILVVFVKK
ncbi:hypothetical protein NPIL_37211 [Nephila pilipes]|uniref:Uncharacterized protein n=1 Tax=Nephila pilipes TaxID=299642 RepID=A0A8X6N1H7_NEPPI|nr:hypothetical protein NPIL_37211 [Nephila pilipes]